MLRLKASGGGIGGRLLVSMVFLSFLAPATSACLPSQRHSGDLVVQREEVVTIENASYTQEGDIIVRDQGRLVLRNVSLAMHGDYSGEHKIYIQGDGKLELQEVRVLPSWECAVWLSDRASASLVKVAGVDLALFDASTVNVEDADILNVMIGGRSKCTLKSSAVSYLVRLGIDTPAPITLTGLVPQRYEKMRIPPSVVTGSSGFALDFTDVQVSGWMVDVKEGAHVTIEDSQLAVIQFDAGPNARGTISGLRLGPQVSWHSTALGVREFPSDVWLRNTTVTDTWGFYVRDGSNLLISDSAISLNLYGRVSMRLERSTVPWFCMEDSTGFIEFDQSSLPGHMVFIDSQATFNGTTAASPGTWLEWSSSSVTRQFTVHVVDTTGRGVPNQSVQVCGPSGASSLKAKTDSNGDARFDVTFVDAYCRGFWTVSSPGHSRTQTLSFLAPSPLELVLSD